MLKASWHKHILSFKFEAKTSRGILQNHDTYYIKLWDTDQPDIVGIGEAAPLNGLSIDYRADFETYLDQFTSNLEIWDDNLFSQFPSIRFGLETAIIDMKNGGKKILFDNDFSKGNSSIKINGLVWMADKVTMKKRIRANIEKGYTTLKLKIGAIEFEEELELLDSIRKEFTQKEIAIRLDANGAFKPKDAVAKLEQLANYTIDSIEQPIKQGQIEEMARLCEQTPIPIALDEELIGIYFKEDKTKLLTTINPQFIILKPTLVGGLKASKEWISEAEKLKIGWWFTSALESNIGLNAISQYASNFKNPLPQGLGTGNLYFNNISSPLCIENGHLKYNIAQKWDDI